MGDRAAVCRFEDSVARTAPAIQARHSNATTSEAGGGFPVDAFNPTTRRKPEVNVIHHLFGNYEYRSIDHLLPKSGLGRRCNHALDCSAATFVHRACVGARSVAVYYKGPIPSANKKGLPQAPNRVLKVTLKAGRQHDLRKI
jgi:hypothetical protein